MARATPILALLYSGGAANSNPALSLGGPASQTAFKFAESQTYTASTIPGIEIVHAARNPEGVGYLSYTASNNSVTWQNPLGVVSTTVIGSQTLVAVGATDTGYLRLEITPGSLPGADTGQNITVAQAEDTLFQNPSGSELTAGVTDYRALYIVNQSSSSIVDIELTLTDAAPESALYVGSTYNPLSQFATPANEGLDFRTFNPFGGVAPYSASMSGTYPREALLTNTYPGTPSMSYYPFDWAQDSNGVDEDVEIQIQDAYDSSNKLALVNWGSALYWTTIGPGRMVSFWTKRVVPPNPTVPTVEKALFDITFTIS